MTPFDCEAAYKHAGRIVRAERVPANDVEDLVQWAVIRAWKAYKKWDKNRASWATFCDRVMVREVRYHLYKDRPAQRVGRLILGLCPGDVIEDFRPPLLGKSKTTGLRPQVRDRIRQAVHEALATGESQVSIARRFAVHKSTICRIAKEIKG